MREAERSTRVGMWRTVTAGEVTNAWAVEEGLRADATRPVSNRERTVTDRGVHAICLRRTANARMVARTG